MAGAGGAPANCHIGRENEKTCEKHDIIGTNLKKYPHIVKITKLIQILRAFFQNICQKK